MNKTGWLVSNADYSAALAYYSLKKKLREIESEVGGITFEELYSIIDEARLEALLQITNSRTNMSKSKEF